MVNAPEFNSLEEMERSDWLAETRRTMMQEQWPRECVRCQETEPHSVRFYAERLDAETDQRDYLQVGGVLDNLCNAACLTCNENHSTRIGSLQGRVFPLINNAAHFRSLPRDRIVHLDINGGEPSFSKHYREILNDLPPNLKSLRLNTNGSTVLTELEHIVHRGVRVIVTVSCDGIGAVHDLLRWPIPWKKFYDNLMTYRGMPVELNLWTTVSVLNQDDLSNIQAFAQTHGIEHSWAYLHSPWQLSVKNTDTTARDTYILEQKSLRDIR